ncbi:MAG: NAD(P)H-hydrate dehydratase [Candidatus Omnitrophica bacterium]|nr:NAD(P)H-hydrate dehydratase [Candidatus Omnitrophota bacterium]
MRLPAPLLRNKRNVYKNAFGHALILAGSRQMLGAGALTALAAMRSGAGLTSIGIPKSLNAVMQKKVSNVVMTVSLPETREQTLSAAAAKTIQTLSEQYDALALGPGLSRNKSTQQLIKNIISQSKIPLVIDADGLNAIAASPQILLKTKTPKILTPHPGEMARLAGTTKSFVEKKRRQIAVEFAKKYQCILLLKGPATLVASNDGRVYINKTGNAGMATAGSGDVLTGMITAFLAQGLLPFDAVKYGAYLHGVAGDLVARDKTRMAMIASDIIEYIPRAVKKACR